MHAAALANRERTYEDVGQVEEQQQPEPGLAFESLLKSILSELFKFSYTVDIRLLDTSGIQMVNMFYSQMVH